jgi:hypothetical protein
LKQTSPIFTSSPASFLRVEVSMIVGQALPPNRSARRVRLRVAADEQHALAHLGHHVAEVGERERLPDAALAVDRDDLRLLGGLGLGNLERRLLVRLVAEALVEILQIGNVEGHAWPFQSRIILRQAGSPKAVS